MTPNQLPATFTDGRIPAQPLYVAASAEGLRANPYRAGALILYGFATLARGFGSLRPRTFVQNPVTGSAAWARPCRAD